MKMLNYHHTWGYMFGLLGIYVYVNELEFAWTGRPSGPIVKPFDSAKLTE